MSAVLEKTFQKYYVQLLECLPMDDVIFLATLYSRGLLPGNLKNFIHSVPSQAEKASLFLDNFIQQSLSIGHNERLFQLLQCMEGCESEILRQLAQEIHADIVASTSPSTSTEIEILNTEPKMIDLIKIVIPRIKADWEYIAYALKYHIYMVKAIREKNRDDPNRCCKDLFEDWLSTDNGAKPKVWSTLIDALKEVDIPMVEVIIAEVEQLGHTHQDEELSHRKKSKGDEKTSSNITHIEDCPTMQQLVKVEGIEHIVTKWYSLGLELLDSNSALKVIKADHHNDVNTCCRVMFEKWLQSTPNASWNHLLTALDNIEMKAAADAIRKQVNSDEGPSQTEKSKSIEKTGRGDYVEFLPENLQDKVDMHPSMEEIHRYVIPQYSSQWKTLGILLGLPSGTLDNIASLRSPDSECCGSMLQKWLQVDLTATWKKLFKAIEKL